MTFGIKSLHLYGAHCEKELLRISRSSLTELKHVRLQWQLKKTKEEVGKLICPDSPCRVPTTY